MKKISLYVLILITVVQCQKENQDCHFFITIKNNSNNEIIFSTGSDFKFSGTQNFGCHIDSSELKLIPPNQEGKYRPYPHPDCIENAIKIDNKTLLYPLYIVNPNNYTTDEVPCEEFEERNTILRTYILTLEDLERLNYTINYPEDVSIGVE